MSLPQLQRTLFLKSESPFDHSASAVPRHMPPVPSLGGPRPRNPLPVRLGTCLIGAPGRSGLPSPPSPPPGPDMTFPAGSGLFPLPGALLPSRRPAHRPGRGEGEEEGAGPAPWHNGDPRGSSSTWTPAQISRADGVLPLAEMPSRSGCTVPASHAPAFGLGPTRWECCLELD